MLVTVVGGRGRDWALYLEDKDCSDADMMEGEDWPSVEFEGLIAVPLHVEL